MPMHHATGKKLLGFWDLMSISLGQIIGTGVVVLTGVSISMTGYGAPWAFCGLRASLLLPFRLFVLLPLGLRYQAQVVITHMSGICSGKRPRFSTYRYWWWGS